MRLFYSFLFLCLWASCPVVVAQSVDIGHLLNYKDKYVRLSGGVFANSVYTYSQDARVAQQPFRYMVGGNVNLQLMSFSLPFSFSYTNQQFAFSQPVRFNRLSVHPKYKWITAHIGDYATSFSSYSLNGMLFTGLGLDIAPPNTNLKLTSLYGKFVRANEPDSFGVAAYTRWGWGIKADYEKDKHKLGLSVFHAKDKAASIQNPEASKSVLPQENLVIDASLNSSISKWLVVDGQYAISTITRDLRFSQGATSKGLLSSIMATNSSTTSYHAYKAGISALLAKATLRLGYERIDPDYTSLGAFYFINDLENITLSLSRNFIKNKLSVALTGGAQRDDLNRVKARASKRFVGSASLGYQASERLSLSGQYSSFQSFSNMRSQFDYINNTGPINPADTLNFAQLSSNISSNLAWTISKSETQMRLFSASLGWQDAADKQGDRVRTGGGSTLINSALSYTIQYPKSGLGLNAGLNGTYNTVGLADMYLIGPAASISKAFAKPKLRTGLSIAYNNVIAGGKSRGDVWNLRANGGATIAKKHQLSLSLSHQLRKSVSGLVPSKRTQLLLASFNYALSL